jgi:hypothetical protein
MPQQTAMAKVTEIVTILVPVMFVFRDLDGKQARHRPAAAAVVGVRR